MCTHLETESSTGDETGKHLDHSTDTPAKCCCAMLALEPLLHAMKTYVVFGKLSTSSNIRVKILRETVIIATVLYMNAD